TANGGGRNNNPGGGGGAGLNRPKEGTEPAESSGEKAPEAGSLSAEEQKEREELQERAGEIIGLAKGDEFGRAKAMKMISVLETSASAKNMDIVRKTKRKVQELMKAAEASSRRDIAEGQRRAAEEEERKKKEAEEAARRQAEEDARRDAAGSSKGGS